MRREAGAHEPDEDGLEILRAIEARGRKTEVEEVPSVSDGAG